jgi:hypothetical protein
MNNRITAKENIFKWIENNLYHFRLEFDKDTKNIKIIKPFAELMHLCALYKQKFKNVNDSRISKIITFCSENVSRSGYIDRLMRDHNLFLTGLTIYTSLREYGIESAKLRHSLINLLPHTVNIELLPFRQIELIDALDKANLVPSTVKNSSRLLESILQSSSLYKISSPFFLNEQDVYALTHAIFYTSDFGLKSIIKLPKLRLLNIKSSIEELLAIYLRKKNWDLVAELLLCCYCLRSFPSPIYNIAWKMLLNAQRKDGSIPGPYFHNEQKKDIKNFDRYYFEENYHTTLVTALACFLDDNNDNMLEYNTNSIMISASSYKSLLHKANDTYRLAYKWMDSKKTQFIVYGEKHTDSMLYLLLGEWIYRNTSRGSSSAKISSIGSKVKSMLETLSKNQTRKLMDYDAVLCLLTTGIMRKLGFKSSVLEEFSDTICQTLGDIKRQSWQEELPLVQVRFLANRIGCVNSFKNIDDIFKNEIDISSLYSDRNIINNFAYAIAALTDFGKNKVPYDFNKHNEVCSAISSATVCAFHDYDLHLGLSLLRTMTYLQLSHTLFFKKYLEYTICQQQQDGRLGFYEPELLRLKEIHDDDIDKFYLLITISSMWTLAEIVNPEFRLFKSI